MYVHVRVCVQHCIDNICFGFHLAPSNTEIPVYLWVHKSPEQCSHVFVLVMLYRHAYSCFRFYVCLFFCKGTRSVMLLLIPATPRH